MSGFMGEDDEPEEEDDYLKPLYEDEEPEAPITRWAPSVSPSRPLPPRTPSPAPTPPTELLTKLSEADTALARLAASAAAAPDMVRDGLVARMVLREASGWLTANGFWVHPHDLALRDLGLTGSYLAALDAGRILRELPNTIKNAHNEGADTIPDDQLVTYALALARHLRRLVEVKSFQPIQTASATGKVFETFGIADYEGEIMFVDWQDAFAPPNTAPLLKALEAARAWRKIDVKQGGDLRAGFIAAAFMRESVPLPLWVARQGILRGRPNLLPFEEGEPAMVTLLMQVAEGARQSMGELDRLMNLHHRRGQMTAAQTARSKTGAAIDLLIRTPCLTPAKLGERLRITPQAATRILRHLTEIGIAKEATGRRSFRAFAV